MPQPVPARTGAGTGCGIAIGGSGSAAPISAPWIARSVGSMRGTGALLRGGSRRAPTSSWRSPRSRPISADSRLRRPRSSSAVSASAATASSARSSSSLAPQPPPGASEDEDLAEEAVAAEAETAEEDRGLRSRLSALIGRDLGDRQDDVGARREPPLKSAPVPRIEPTDRAIHGADIGAAEPEPPIAMPQPVPAPVRAGTGCGLSTVSYTHLRAHATVLDL